MLRWTIGPRPKADASPLPYQHRSICRGDYAPWSRHLGSLEIALAWSQRGADDLGRRQALANAGEMLAAPVEIGVVEQEARHTEHAGVFCLAHDLLQFATADLLCALRAVMAFWRVARRSRRDRAGRSILSLSTDDRP